MKIVYWKHKETGIIKHGNPVPDDSADAAVKKMNAKDTYLYHWAEPVEKTPETASNQQTKADLGR